MGHTSLLPNPHTCMFIQGQLSSPSTSFKRACCSSSSLPDQRSRIKPPVSHLHLHPPSVPMQPLQPTRTQKLSIFKHRLSVGPVTINAGVQKWTLMELNTKVTVSGAAKRGPTSYQTHELRVGRDSRSYVCVSEYLVIWCRSEAPLASISSLAPQFLGSIHGVVFWAVARSQAHS